MKLPVAPPVQPMLARRVADLPAGDGWIYEPKWDGFRAIVFRDGDDVLVQSRDERPLNRYFPELVGCLRRALPARIVLDGEIVVARGEGLDFEALQLRLHPAASRAALLAEEVPASLVFFDLLCEGERDWTSAPFRERRRELESVLAGAEPPLYLTPATSLRSTAKDWFQRFEGAGLDGVIAKAELGTYEPNKRVMLKVKHERECDCVVAGFRWHKGGEGERIGSLLLGLYDARERLEHVGVVASFTQDKRRELVSFLAPYREGALEAHPWRGWASRGSEGGRRRPGEKSRWSQDKDLSWEALRPELVVEVAYDHMQGSRFRHTAQFRRFRLDKPARACTFDQLEVVAPHELRQFFLA